VDTFPPYAGIIYSDGLSRTLLHVHTTQFKDLLAAIFKYDWSGGPVVMETFTGE
jgi:hypothetical protein